MKERRQMKETRKRQGKRVERERERDSKIKSRACLLYNTTINMSLFPNISIYIYICSWHLLDRYSKKYQYDLILYH